MKAYHAFVFYFLVSGFTHASVISLPDQGRFSCIKTQAIIVTTINKTGKSKKIFNWSCELENQPDWQFDYQTAVQFDKQGYGLELVGGGYLKAATDHGGAFKTENTQWKLITVNNHVVGWKAQGLLRFTTGIFKHQRYQYTAINTGELTVRIDYRIIMPTMDKQYALQH